MSDRCGESRAGAVEWNRRGMRFVSFVRHDAAGFGVVVDDDTVADLTGVLAGVGGIRDLLAQDRVAEAADAAASAPTCALSELQLTAVVPNPSKVICVGINYVAHAAEAGRTVGEHPVIFQRYAETLTGHGQPLLRPQVSEEFDFEGEIAVIIGKGGDHIAPQDALDHVAGYALFNDASVRDWQFHTHQYGMGKNFRSSGAFGPWMVTADEIAADQKMTLITRLNGREMQRATTDMMVHSIPRQIAYISAFVPLEPGDVIVTGTPGGVGNKRTPQVFMKPGDVCEIEVDAIGVLRNGIRDE